MNSQEKQWPIYRTMVSGKIHRATVTGADVDYVGSISVDQDLLEAADIYVGQQVDVVNVTNGERLTTYTIEGERGSGAVQINGAAAHKVSVGDLVIVMAYAQVPEATAQRYKPRVVHVNAENDPIDVGDDLAS